MIECGKISSFNWTEISMTKSCKASVYEDLNCHCFLIFILLTFNWTGIICTCIWFQFLLQIMKLKESEKCQKSAPM